MILPEYVFVQKLEEYYREKDVLEIGCGDGSRLAAVVRASRSWTGIDPDPVAVAQANDENEEAKARFFGGPRSGLLRIRLY